MTRLEAQTLDGAQEHHKAQLRQALVGHSEWTNTHEGHLKRILPGFDQPKCDGYHSKREPADQPDQRAKKEASCVVSRIAQKNKAGKITQVMHLRFLDFLGDVAE